jgi:hypothetical protein
VFSVLSVEFNVEYISENYRIDNMSFAHNLIKGNLQNVDYLDYRLLQHVVVWPILYTYIQYKRSFTITTPFGIDIGNIVKEQLSHLCVVINGCKHKRSFSTFVINAS